MPYQKLFITVCVTLVAGGVTACERSPTQHAATQPAVPMTTEQVIRHNANAPVGRSITPIASSLATQTIFVATDDTTTTQPTTVTPERLRFKTAKDNQGRTWAYAYTNQAEFSRAFPQGGGFAELSFNDFFGIVERTPDFAGLYLNAGSDASYPIPRELFGQVKEALTRPTD